MLWEGPATPPGELIATTNALAPGSRRNSRIWRSTAPSSAITPSISRSATRLPNPNPPSSPAARTTARITPVRVMNETTATATTVRTDRRATPTFAEKPGVWIRDRRNGNRRCVLKSSGILVSAHLRYEPVEQVPRIVRSWRGLRMVLDAEHRQLPVLQPFHGV